MDEDGLNARVNGLRLSESASLPQLPSEPAMATEDIMHRIVQTIHACNSCVDPQAGSAAHAALQLLHVQHPLWNKRTSSNCSSHFTFSQHISHSSAFATPCNPWLEILKLQRQFSWQIRFMVATVIRQQICNACRERVNTTDEDCVHMISQLLPIVQSYNSSLNTAQIASGNLHHATTEQLTSCIALLAVNADDCLPQLFQSLLSSARSSPLHSIPATFLLRFIKELANACQTLEKEEDILLEESDANEIRIVLAQYLQGSLSRVGTADIDVPLLLIQAIGSKLCRVDMLVLHQVGAWQSLCTFYSNILASAATAILATPETEIDLPTMPLIATLSESIVHFFPYYRQQSPERHAATSILLHTIVQHIQSIYQSLSNHVSQQLMRDASAGKHIDPARNTAESVCQHIANVVLAFGSKEIVFLARSDDSNDTQGILLSLCSSYFQFLLSFMHHPFDAELLCASLSVWSALEEEIPNLDQRRQIACIRDKSTLYISLIHALLNHAAYPSSFQSWLPSLTMIRGNSMTLRDVCFYRFYCDDADAFSRSRSEILNKLAWIRSRIGGHACALTVCNWMKQATSNTPIASSEWYYVEAALLALTSVCKSIQRSYSSLALDQPTPSSMEEDEDLQDGGDDPGFDSGDEYVMDESERTKERQLFELVLHFLWTSIFPMAVASTTSSSSSMQSLLVTTACAFIEQSSFLFTLTPALTLQPASIENHIQFLLHSIPLTQEHCQASPSQPRPTFDTIVAPFRNLAHCTPTSGCSMAGHAFLSLSSQHAPIVNYLSRAPQIMAQVMNLLFPSSNTAADLASQPRISPSMRQLWLRGLVNLTAARAYSSESTSQVLSSLASTSASSSVLSCSPSLTHPGSIHLANSMGEFEIARSYLKGLSQPTILALQQLTASPFVSPLLRPQQSPALGPSFAPLSPPALAPHSPAIKPSVPAVAAAGTHDYASSLLDHLTVLHDILAQLSVGLTVAHQQRKHQLELASITAKAPIHSLAYNLIEFIWTTLQQILPSLHSSLTASPMVTRNIAATILDIYSHIVMLLFPSEFFPLISFFFHTSFQFFQSSCSDLGVPVLQLLERILRRFQLGHQPELRELCTRFLQQFIPVCGEQIKRALRSNEHGSTAGVAAARDLMERFFLFATGLLECCTWCFFTQHHHGNNSFTASDTKHANRSDGDSSSSSISLPPASSSFCALDQVLHLARMCLEANSTNEHAFHFVRAFLSLDPTTEFSGRIVDKHAFSCLSGAALEGSAWFDGSEIESMRTGAAAAWANHGEAILRVFAGTSNSRCAQQCVGRQDGEAVVRCLFELLPLSLQYYPAQTQSWLAVGLMSESLIANMALLQHHHQQRTASTSFSRTSSMSSSSMEAHLNDQLHDSS